MFQESAYEEPMSMEENPSEPSVQISDSPLSIRRKKTIRKAEEQENLATEVLHTVQEHFKKPRVQEDRFDVIGKTIAIKLRGLPKQQMLIAEKLMNDTLFQAEMGSLTLSHRLDGGVTYNSFHPYSPECTSQGSSGTSSTPPPDRDFSRQQQPNTYSTTLNSDNLNDNMSNFFVNYNLNR